MTKKDVENFIEIMKEIKEDWTPEEVLEEYGGLSLSDIIRPRF